MKIFLVLISMIILASCGEIRGDATTLVVDFDNPRKLGRGIIREFGGEVGVSDADHSPNVYRYYKVKTLWIARFSSESYVPLNEWQPRRDELDNQIYEVHPAQWRTTYPTNKVALILPPGVESIILLCQGETEQTGIRQYEVPHSAIKAGAVLVPDLMTLKSCSDPVILRAIEGVP